MKTRIVAIAISLLAFSACDDEEHADQLGGGPGSSDASNIVVGDGFCGPQGGAQALGTPSYNSSSSAKLDLDGNPAAQGLDPDWHAGTAGIVNGQPVNSAKYAYVVMSPGQMAANNVSLGDWATVTNNSTGQTVYGRVEDIGPEGGTGEISQAAAGAVGIQQTVVQTKDGPSTVTVGSPSVTVDVYAWRN
jgi:hypothetical protein